MVQQRGSDLGFAAGGPLLGEARLVQPGHLVRPARDGVVGPARRRRGGLRRAVGRRSRRRARRGGLERGRAHRLRRGRPGSDRGDRHLSEPGRRSRAGEHLRSYGPRRRLPRGGSRPGARQLVVVGAVPVGGRPGLLVERPERRRRRRAVGSVHPVLATLRQPGGRVGHAAGAARHRRQGHALLRAGTHAGDPPRGRPDDPRRPWPLPGPAHRRRSLGGGLRFRPPLLHRRWRSHHRRDRGVPHGCSPRRFRSGAGDGDVHRHRRFDGSRVLRWATDSGEGSWTNTTGSLAPWSSGSRESL